MKPYEKEVNKVLNNYSIVRSYSFNEEEIISWIIQLYCPEGIELDPTYRIGSIYKNLQKPKLKFDLSPQSSDIIKSDCRNLPLDDNLIQSILFDPPFLIRKVPMTKDKKRPIMCNDFTCFKTLEESKLMYLESLAEFRRILKPKGILIFKCQDIVHHTKQVFYHNFIINNAEAIGLEPLDLFLRLNKSVPIRNKLHKQKFARKFHCYYLVFRKK